MVERIYRKGELKLFNITRENIRIKASYFHKQIKNLWSQSATLKSIIAVGLGDLLSQIINVFSAIVLIRGLTVADYAAFSAMNSVANLSAGVVGTGINLALVRFSANYYSRTGNKLNSLYYFVFVFEIILFLIVTIVAISFPKKTTMLILGDIDFITSLQFGLLYGMGILFTQLGRSIYQAEEKFNQFIYVLLLRQGLTLIVMFNIVGFEVTFI